MKKSMALNASATLVTRLVPLDFGGTSPLSMVAWTALTCSVLRCLCNLATAAFSLYDQVRGVHVGKDCLKVFKLESFEVFCGFLFLFRSGFARVRNRNEEAI